MAPKSATSRGPVLVKELVDVPEVEFQAQPEKITADGKLTDFDAVLAARNSTHLNNGLSAYALTDPRIVGNVTGTGVITSSDASLLAQAVAISSLPLVLIA